MNPGDIQSSQLSSRPFAATPKGQLGHWRPSKDSCPLATISFFISVAKKWLLGFSQKVRQLLWRANQWRGWRRKDQKNAGSRTVSARELGLPMPHLVTPASRTAKISIKRLLRPFCLGILNTQIDILIRIRGKPLKRGSFPEIKKVWDFYRERHAW